MLLGLLAMGLIWQLGLTQLLLRPAALTHDQRQRDPTAGGAAYHTEHASTQGQSGACQCQGELFSLGCAKSACRPVGWLHCWRGGGWGPHYSTAGHKGSLGHASVIASFSPHSIMEPSMLQDASGWGSLGVGPCYPCQNKTPSRLPATLRNLLLSSGSAAGLLGYVARPVPGCPECLWKYSTYTPPTSPHRAPFVAPVGDPEASHAANPRRLLGSPP